MYVSARGVGSDAPPFLRVKWEAEQSVTTAGPTATLVRLTLSRRAVTETQPDTDVLHEQRPDYATDADLLIAVSHVVAVHFQTVAEANDYWRE